MMSNNDDLRAEVRRKSARLSEFKVELDRVKAENKKLTKQRNAAELLLVESRDPVKNEYYESGNHEIDPDDMWEWQESVKPRIKFPKNT